MTHTVATIGVTPQTFYEIHRLLSAADYYVEEGFIDMNGLAISLDEDRPPSLIGDQGCCVCDNPAEFWCKSWRIPLCREHAHKDGDGFITDKALP